MSDGRITIAIDVDGKPVKNAVSDLKNFEDTARKSATGSDEVKKSLKDIDGKKAQEAASDIKNLGEKSKESASGVSGVSDAIKGVDGKPIDDTKQKMNDFGEETQKGEKSVKNFVTALGLVKVAAAAFGVLKNSMDAAISRFDTMNKFPKVMNALGFSAEESSEAINKLADGIDGLPTKLDEVVGTAQRMTAVTGNMNKSTNATIALNNAMIASGASSDKAARGTEQYVKMLSTGKIEMDSWTTLQETMPIGLQKVAEAMGYVGESAQTDLYDALKDGTVHFKDFQNQLIELGTGTGELAELAKINSESFATSFGNLGNATSKGLANVLGALDEVSEAISGKTLAGNLDSFKAVINATFNVITKAITSTTPYVKGFVDVLGEIGKAIQPLTPTILSFAAAYATLKIIDSVNTYMKQSVLVTNAITAATKLWELATQAQARAELGLMAANKINNVVMGAKSALIGAQITMSTALAGTQGAVTVATGLATAATIAFNTAIKLLTGPIGWATAALGALVAVGVNVWKWFNKETEAAKALKEEQEGLAESSNALNDEIKQNAANRKDNLTSIESNAKAYQDLGNKITELQAKENKSAADKKLLSDSIEQLNESVDGLNLAYDEENNALSLTTEAMKKRIDAYKQQEIANESMQELTNILSEQHDIESKLNETTALRDDWNNKLADGAVKSKEAKEAIAELDTQEELLKGTLSDLKEEQVSTQETIETANAAIAQAVEEGVMKQVISYNTLSEQQQKAVDSMRTAFQSLQEGATNAFEKIKTDSEINMKQMEENLAHNQEAVRAYGENQAALLEWAGKSGHDAFIPFIESIGLDQAGVLAEMTKGLDNNNQEQSALLENLATRWEQGFGTAAEAGKNSMKIGLEGLPEEIKNMVIAPTESLNAEVKTAFEGFGSNIGDGAETGIKNSTKQVGDASENMAKEADNRFTSYTQIKSPSRLFKSHGNNIGEGLTLGIMGQTSKVSEAINTIAKSLDRPFDGLQNRMMSTGINAMQGLNIGLQNGANAVYSTAQSIANNIKQTIESALDIHSPSRWFRDQIGKNMMLGWGIGIESNSQYPRLALEKAIDKITLPVVRAESALNIGSTATGSIVNNDQRTSSQTHVTNNYEGFMKGANLQVRNDEDIPKLAKEVVKELERFNPNRTPGLARNYF